MIAAAGITRQQKEKLLAHFHSQQLVQTVARRARVARKP
jgi:CTP:molybdopterin cytidylyltransferase MocA